MHFGSEHFSQRLFPILEQFCKDSDDEIRSIMASGFHEIVQLNEKCKNQNLLSPFLELMCSGNAEVVQHMAANLNKTLPLLYKQLKDNNCISTEKFDIKLVSIVGNGEGKGVE